MDFLTRADSHTYDTLMSVWAGLAILSCVGLHLSGQLPISSRKPEQWLSQLGSIDKKTGWILMESPVLIAVSYFYWTGSNALDASAVIVGAFVLHYVHRALIFPHRIKVQGKTMPVVTVVAVMIFYTVNGYMIGHYFGSLRAYPVGWLIDPRFLLGSVLFVVGFAVNVSSDNILIGLRAPGESGYKIPHGGLFEYVSCPNFFGEIVQWIGFAILSWSLPGLIYAAWVSLTLLSMGLSTHRWYVEHFGEAYPRERKAIVPRLM